MTRDCFQALQNNIWRLSIRLETKICLLNVYVFPVLLYGAETWSLTSVLEKKLGACQQWCLRKLLRISHLQRVTNTEMLRPTNQSQLWALYSSVWQTSTALRTCCQVRCADGPFESTAQLFQGYRVTGGVLPAYPDSHGREPLRKIWVHSASVCTQHGDELRIVNSGKEPWKRLCSSMGPALDDDDDDDDIRDSV